MKKTVLFLMNGFGVEQIGSFNIYNDKLMPNLDKFTKEYLFAPIESKAYDIVSGYRTFSTGSPYSLTYSLINNYVDKFETNKNFEFYLSNIKPDGKIHIFFSLENEKGVEQLRSFLNFIKSKKQNSIFVHLVLTNNNINDYKEIERLINKFVYDIKTCKVGIIVGKNVLSAINMVSLINLFQKEVGERWREINKKMVSLTTSKILPVNVKEFYMNNGFKLEANDSIFFFNYEYADFSSFTNAGNKITNSECFSSFQINGVKYPMFAYPKSGISSANSLAKIDAKTLILSNKENIKTINYYCCGLQNIVSPNISFARTDKLNFELIKSIIRDSDYDLIIFNYQVDDVKSVTELNNKLSRLDMMLGEIKNFCVEKKYSLFISSLYGMQKEMAVDNFTNAMVDFSSKVPFIVIDPVFKKSNFIIGLGNIYNLAHTVYTNINNKYDGGEVLIKKKNFLVKLLKK